MIKFMSEFDAARGLPPFVGDVPYENANSTLASYDTLVGGVEDPHRVYAKQLAEDFTTWNHGPAGLMLTGPAGNGKTHLAVGIAREVAAAGGRAAFLSVKDGMVITSTVPGRDLGWYRHEDELVSMFDLIVVDDVPGSMSPGGLHVAQQLVMEAFKQGKKMALTSNLAAGELARMVIVPTRGVSGPGPDMSVALADRIEQTWQSVEFAGESYRADQPKWWGGLHRPEDMPRTLDELMAGMREAANYSLLLGGAILELAQRSKAKEGPYTAALREFLAHQPRPDETP
jgi:hypothetical protein